MQTEVRGSILYMGRLVKYIFKNVFICEADRLGEGDCHLLIHSPDGAVRGGGRGERRGEGRHWSLDLEINPGHPGRGVAGALSPDSSLPLPLRVCISRKLEPEAGMEPRYCGLQVS